MERDWRGMPGCVLKVSDIGVLVKELRRQGMMRRFTRSTVELHRQAGARVRPLHIAISVVREQWGPVFPRVAAPAASRLEEASRGRTGAALPGRCSGRSEGRACLPALPRRPSSKRRAGGTSSPAPPPPAGRGTAERMARIRHARHRRQGSNLRLRGQRPPSCHWTTPVYVSLDDPRGLEPPYRRLRGGCSAFELRVERWTGEESNLHGLSRRTGYGRLGPPMPSTYVSTPLYAGARRPVAFALRTHVSPAAARPNGYTRPRISDAPTDPPPVSSIRPVRDIRPQKATKAAWVSRAAFACVVMTSATPP